MKLYIVVFLPFLLAINVSAQCLCPSGIGSREGDKPFLSYTSPDGSKQLILCGFVEEAKSPAVVIAAEFEVVPCDTRKSVLRVGALETCRVEKSQSALLITKFAWLPYGEKWKWVNVAYERYKLWYDDTSRLQTETALVFKRPEISEAQSREVLEEYTKQRQSGRLTEELTFKILAVALNGNKEAEAKLLNMKKDLKLDGALAELHEQAMAIYHQFGRK